MTNHILWSPKNKNNYLSDFINNLKKNKFIKNNNYDLLHKWSVNNKKEFAEVSVFWSPINKLISSLFLIIILASIFVFSTVLASSGTFNLETLQLTFFQENTQPNNYEINETIVKENKD